MFFLILAVVILIMLWVLSHAFLFLPVGPIISALFIIAVIAYVLHTSKTKK